MKISIFTGNQPRHSALIEKLALLAQEVTAVTEVLTVFPGEIEDFYKKTPVMQAYFKRVIAAERAVFGEPRFLPAHVRVLPLKLGDLNRISETTLAPALHADIYIVFGASYIRGWLADFLVSKQAVNIHMGVSPYYRGSACNFWALFDRHPEYVGATIHFLSKGLDSGKMLFHALPPEMDDPFLLGMKAVQAAEEGLAARIADNTLLSMKAMPQDRAQRIRYSRYADFTDEAAQYYLDHPIFPEEMQTQLKNRDRSKFLRPYFGSKRAAPAHSPQE